MDAMQAVGDTNHANTRGPGSAAWHGAMWREVCMVARRDCYRDHDLTSKVYYSVRSGCLVYCLQPCCGKSSALPVVPV